MTSYYVVEHTSKCSNLGFKHAVRSNSSMPKRMPHHIYEHRRYFLQRKNQNKVQVIKNHWSIQVKCKKIREEWGRTLTYIMFILHLLQFSGQTLWAQSSPWPLLSFLPSSSFLPPLSQIYLFLFSEENLALPSRSPAPIAKPTIYDKTKKKSKFVIVFASKIPSFKHHNQETRKESSQTWI